MNSPETHRDIAQLDGADYVALVIEWEDEADVATLVRDRKQNPSGTTRGRTIATVVGALAAIAFASWGIRHLRHAA